MCMRMRKVKCVPHACEFGGGGALIEGLFMPKLQTERKKKGNGYVACRVDGPTARMTRRC